MVERTENTNQVSFGDDTMTTFQHYQPVAGEVNLVNGGQNYLNVSPSSSLNNNLSIDTTRRCDADIHLQTNHLNEASSIHDQTHNYDNDTKEPVFGIRPKKHHHLFRHSNGEEHQQHHGLLNKFRRRKIERDILKDQENMAYPPPPAEMINNNYMGGQVNTIQ